MRKIKRLVALLAVVVVLGAGTLKPKPARALSSVEEGFILAGVAIAAYVAFIVIGTTLTNRNRACFPPYDTDSTLDPMPAQGELRFGQHCTQGSGDLTVVCW